MGYGILRPPQMGPHKRLQLLAGEIKDSMGPLHIRLQLFTITPILFAYNYSCRRVKWDEHRTYETLKDG